MKLTVIGPPGGVGREFLEQSPGRRRALPALALTRTPTPVPQRSVPRADAAHLMLGFVGQPQAIHPATGIASKRE